MQDHDPNADDSEFSFYCEDEEYYDVIDHILVEPKGRHLEANCYDRLLLTEPLLPRGGGLERATIIGRKRDADGNPVGHYNMNPVLNTRFYLAEFADGFIAEYSANVIANAIYSPADDDGFEHTLCSGIIGHHKKQDALKPEDAFVSTQGSQNFPPIRTPKGWDIWLFILAPTHRGPQFFSNTPSRICRQ